MQKKQQQIYGDFFYKVEEHNAGGLDFAIFCSCRLEEIFVQV